jgi:excisionase family DNA binding protein
MNSHVRAPQTLTSPRGIFRFNYEVGRRLTKSPIPCHKWTVLDTKIPPVVERHMRLFTLQEVADTMRVSQRTVRRLIKRGDLAAYKVGDRGQLRVKERDIEGYLESQRIQIELTNGPDETVAEPGQ